jgi:hypothetical protein
MSASEIPITSWNEFEAVLATLYDDMHELRRKQPLAVSEPVFRGHSNSKWQLDTTLDRSIGRGILFRDYYKKVLYPSLRLLSRELDFDLPDLPNLELSVADLRGNIPLFEQMALVRHHGFPCPLLDWTLSPYVAAFFAFHPEPHAASHVAIYSYQEHFGDGKGYQDDRASIRFAGHFASVHERHIRQQSRYTTAVRPEGSHMHFCSHEHAIKEKGYEWLRFDEVTKFILPIGLRAEALAALRRMNITLFSLFGTTDALVQTVARNAIDQIL